MMHQESKQKINAIGVFALFLLFLAAPAAAQDERANPEIATGTGQVSVAQGTDFMIVTANPHATRAGYEILKRGGSAADAGIAAQLVLGLVEPQSSGLGGGAFALYYDADENRLSSYDARETAPALAGPYLFHEQGEPMGFRQAQLGGRSVGVPGVPALLEHLHQSYGAVTWMELFEEAISLSENGFEVSPRLEKMIAEARPRLEQFPQTADYFLNKERLVNDAYAQTLRDFAFSGADIFYSGQYAADIVETVQNIADNPGLLTLEDFKAYQLKERDVLCGPYRAYIVCSMSEPSSGGLTLLQILGMLEHYDLREENDQNWHIIAQASALAFADRNAYMADPDFVKTPGTALLDPDYLQQRAALIDLEKPPAFESGQPPLWDGELYGEVEHFDLPGTTHISVVDAQGNILSLTSSIESAFGSHVMTNGFLLNNQLTDFAFQPYDEAGKPVANRVEGGKRPRSSMSPTIIFDQQGEPVLVIGSAGGSRIIGYVLQRIISVIDWERGIDEAVMAPNKLSRSGKLEIESEDVPLNSGLTAIQIKDNIIRGAADPRREGIAQGR